VIDRNTKTPLQDARIRITREVGGDEIATLQSTRDGRFEFNDDLNKYIGQQIVFTVEHRMYRAHQITQLAEREFTITLAMALREVAPPPDPVRNWKLLLLWVRTLDWFHHLLSWQRWALAAAPVVVVIVAALAWLTIGRVWHFPPQQPVACDKPSIQRASTAEDHGLLWHIAGLCADEKKTDLQFEAVENCSRRDDAACLMQMASWYDPQQGAEWTPFRQRDGVLAAQYYRQARSRGAEDARPRLDALCRALRQQSDQAALDAGC
jgi:hypothetical protein